MVRTGLAVLCGLMLAAAQLSAAPVMEIEPNDTLGAPQLIADTAFTRPAPAHAFGNYPTASIQGTITDADIDFYSFAGLAGQGLYFDIDDTPSGSFLGLALFNPDGLLFAFSVGSDLDPGSVAFDPFIGVIVLPTTGAYTVGVFDGGGTEIKNLPPLSAQATLIRPDGTDGGVRFAPVVPDIDVDTLGVDTDYTLHISSAVPEPSSIVLMLTGMLGGALILRRRHMRGGQVRPQAEV